VIPLGCVYVGCEATLNGAGAALFGTGAAACFGRGVMQSARMWLAAAEMGIIQSGPLQERVQQLARRAGVRLKSLL